MTEQLAAVPPVVAVLEHCSHRAPRIGQLTAGTQLLVDPGTSAACSRRRAAIRLLRSSLISRVRPTASAASPASRLLRCQASLAFIWAVSRSS
jgi:hypothetical protein